MRHNTKESYDRRAQSMQPVHRGVQHLYRQIIATAALVARAAARWLRECDYWWRGDTNVYPFEHIALSRTPQMLLLEAASRVPARAMQVA